MLRSSPLICALTLAGTGLVGIGAAPSVSAQLLSPPPADQAPAPAQPEHAAPAPSAADEHAFTVFRHDLINLIILNADPRLLVAAAQIAAPDEKDASRSAIKKTPGMLQRAQKFGAQDPLVLWVSAANACLSKPGCADPAALKTLENIDADNAAVWLRSFPSDGNAVKAQSIVARMAQTQRYDDYWAADVVALYHALEVLPVPAAVTRQGIGASAARVNFATSIASALLPEQLQQFGKFCSSVDGKETGLVADCIAVARKLETGGTFLSQSTGFAVEDSLLTAGVDHDVMQARKRSAVWQKEKFFELSSRFSREPDLAQSYIRLLGSEQNELAAIVAMLREQNLHSDPPAGWQPAEAPKADPLAPAAQH